MPSIERRVRDGEPRCYARLRHRAAYSHTLAADTTRVRKRSVLDRHLLPTMRNRPVGTITPATVAAALGRWSRTLAPGTVGQVLRHVRQIVSVAVSRWPGDSSPDITYRGYAYLKPDDELAGRDAIAKTMRQVLPHVYPVCTERGSD